MINLITLLVIAAAPDDRVAVSFRSIPKGALITTDNVSFTPKKSLKLRRGFKPYRFAARDKVRTRRTIPPGTPVGLWDAEPMPDVAVGEQVTVEVIRGRLRVTAAAVAKEDGHAGQNIWVQNASSQKRLRVRVVGPGLVRLMSPWRRGSP